MDREDIVRRLLKIIVPCPGPTVDTEHMDYIADVLEQVSKYVDINDILDNVIFIYHSLPAITALWSYSPSVIISFNLSATIDEATDTNEKLNVNKVKSIIAHEFAHYKLKHIQGGIRKSHNEMDKEADDLIENWGFERAYTYK